MLGWHVTQPQRGGFSGNVALRHGQHFVTNHKFLYRCRTQQRRGEMCVEAEFRIVPALGGALMKAHCLWERRAKYIVVTNGGLLKYPRQRGAFLVTQFIESRLASPADEQGLKGPDCPEGHEPYEMVVGAYQPLLFLQFKFQVIVEQRRVMQSSVVRKSCQFLRQFIG